MQRTHPAMGWTSRKSRAGRRRRYGIYAGHVQTPARAGQWHTPCHYHPAEPFDEPVRAGLAWRDFGIAQRENPTTGAALDNVTYCIGVLQKRIALMSEKGPDVAPQVQAMLDDARAKVQTICIVSEAI